MDYGIPQSGRIQGFKETTSYANPEPLEEDRNFLFFLFPTGERIKSRSVA
jgi:hypothetical protein